MSERLLRQHKEGRARAPQRSNKFKQESRDKMFNLETEIRSWSDHLRSRGNFLETDITELENHLRDEIEDLIKTGLAPDEAFLIGVKRLGNVDSISREFSKVNTENLWKQLLVEPMNAAEKGKKRKDVYLLIIFSLIAGTLAKIPELFGYHLFQSAAELFYFKNLSLFVLPLFAAFFLVKRRPGWKLGAAVMGSFLVAALAINLYPFLPPKQTEVLTGIHLPMLLWLITGVAYMGAQWRTVGRRMDFIRFTGETAIYTGLVFCGVVVLGLFTMGIFAAIQVKVEGFVREYLLVYGGCAAALITGYLVEAKKSVVENFAPILAKIFSPLFFLAMVIFLLVMVITGKSPFVDRNFLIGFDLMLALVLGLVLYVISARGIHEKRNYFDYLNLALILVALIIDGIALSAIIFRLSAFGITPNKVAALGENLVLLVNLGGLAWHYLRFLLKKAEFGMIEKWQTVYLYAYVGWMALVAFLFPVFFGFR